MAASTDPVPDAPQSVVLCELGPLGVEADGRWSAVRGPRMSMLLAALGLAGRSDVGTEELMEVIWPSPDQPSSARQSLANIVLRVRTSYGAAFVESTRGGYRLGAHVQSDRERFLAGVDHATELVAHAPDRALRLVEQVLARWRGDPWLGIERPVNVESDRTRLSQARTSALRVRASALIALDRRELAVADLREMLDTDPFDEFSRYHLVRILAGTGQRAEALRSIQEANRLFAERGLLIDAALVQEEQRLLSAAFTSNAEMEPLPEHRTDFVGRQREIAELADGLRSSRLVTVLGIGGSGKTRLAVQTASSFSEPATCGFVGLAGARSRGQIELAFARGLGLPHNRLDGLDADERVEALASAAAASSGALVIDNCEHVLPDLRALVTRLLARPGHLRMLATSRVPLDVAGEYRYPIPPFTQAAELFRRRSAQHGIPLHADQHPDVVARICELVDHLPLAVEIAAAQTPYRTVREIADELELGIVHRDAGQPERRHETMAATIRWSHQLLDVAAADALVRLGVFGAPFRRSDAAAVIESGDPSAVLDTLVRHSLTERSDDDGVSNYRLAVPVQQYCATELERRGATTEVLVALADWLLELTDRPYGDVWWRLSVIDEVNPRLPHALPGIAALRAVGRIDDATRLASRLGGAARAFGHADELISLLTGPWSTCNDAQATADALVAIALCADAARKRKVVNQAVRELGLLEGPAGRRHRVFFHCQRSLVAMWTALLGDADFRPANDELRRARDHAEALDSPINHAQLEMWQSGVYLLAGDWTSAEAAARRSLEHSAGTTFDLLATSCLCHARLQQGDTDAALQLATSHALRSPENPHGDLLGIVAAIARVQGGETDAGLADISRIQRRARRAPFAIQQDDAAIAIAYIAHLMRQDDLSLQIIETGVLGYGPWVGYLVPKMCRDLRIPLMGHDNKSVAERQERSDFYGTVASRVLDELDQRWN